MSASSQEAYVNVIVSGVASEPLGTVKSCVVGTMSAVHGYSTKSVGDRSSAAPDQLRSLTVICRSCVLTKLKMTIGWEGQ